MGYMGGALAKRVKSVHQVFPLYDLISTSN